MPYMTKIIQKLGHHASNLFFVGALSMNSLNLGETWLLDKKSRNLVEWDTFRLWLVIACNRQNRCDKSTAQRFWTAIVRAMGQQKRSKRTISNSIDLVLKPNLSHFSFLKSPHKKHVFSNFLGLIWRGTRWVLQKVVHACVTTKCRAWQKSSRN